jgi:hypothetical protein
MSSLLEQDTNKWGRFTGSSDATSATATPANSAESLARLESLKSTVAQMIVATHSDDCKDALEQINLCCAEMTRLMEPTEQKVSTKGLGIGAATGTPGR